MSAPFFVSFLSFVRLKIAWDVRVSHGGTEGTEFFQRFVCSFLRVLFELCEIENCMGYIKSFARRHGGHGGFSRLCLLLSVSFVVSVRAENGVGCMESFARRHGGFSRLCLRLSVSFVNFVRSENGMGCVKSFARRHGGHGGFSRLCLLLSVSFVVSVRAENGVGCMESFARRHGGFSRLCLRLSVSFVNFVRSENGMGCKSFIVHRRLWVVESLGLEVDYYQSKTMLTTIKKRLNQLTPLDLDKSRCGIEQAVF